MDLMIVIIVIQIVISMLCGAALCDVVARLRLARRLRSREDELRAIIKSIVAEHNTLVEKNIELQNKISALTFNQKNPIFTRK